jgi:hypothetical protein
MGENRPPVGYLFSWSERTSGTSEEVTIILMSGVMQMAID